VHILAVNVGSSSLKLRVLDDNDVVVATKDLPISTTHDLAPSLAAFLDESPAIDAAGHRVVNGGQEFTEPILLDKGIDTALATLPTSPPCTTRGAWQRSARCLCYDPSWPRCLFRHELSPQHAGEGRHLCSARGVARAVGHPASRLPRAQSRVASRRASELVGRPREKLRLVTAHLGSGASLAAVAFGHSVDTTMGFTPMEGLVMSTRSGSLDPGVILWVQQRKGLSAADVEEILERESGLLGLTDKSGDLRHVIDAADAGDSKARLAYESTCTGSKPALPPCAQPWRESTAWCSQAEQARHPPGCEPTHARVFRSSA